MGMLRQAAFDPEPRKKLELFEAEAAMADCRDGIGWE
jgi:hypothetical protein